jgi:hypothetical protein
MVMTRNQVKNVEAALTGPRTRSKAAVLEKSWASSDAWMSEEKGAAKILVDMKTWSIGSDSSSAARPRRSCARY